MAKYEVELTDTEDKAMTYVAADTQDWTENFLKVRARKKILKKKRMI